MLLRTLLAIALFFVSQAVSQAVPQAAQQTTSSKTSWDQKAQNGDIEGALRDCQQALASVAAGPESPEAAGLMLDIAGLLYRKGDYAASRARGEEALAIYQKTYGAEHATVARALDTIGLARLGAGDYQGATPVFEHALAVAQKTLGPEHETTVGILERLDLNLIRAGDYSRASVLGEQALAICEQHFPGDHIVTLDALRNLGQLHSEMGDYADALRYQLRALPILERREGKDSVQVGDTLNNMGNTARGAGSNTAARDYFARAAAIYEARLGPHNTRLGGALDNLGQSLTLLKQFPGARSALERALAVQTQELGARHPWTANVLQSMGRLEAAAGNYQKARELYQQNLDIWRERLGPEHPFTVATITLLSDTLAHLGERRMALDTALEAANIRRDNIVRTVRTANEKQAIEFAQLHAASLDVALTIAATPEPASEDVERAWNALIRSRALVLDEMSARHRSLRQSADPEVVTLEQQVASGRSGVTRLVLEGPGKSTLADYSAKVYAARIGLERSEELLAGKSAQFRHEFDQRGAGYAEVKRALPAGSALVAFRRYSRKNYTAAGDAATDSYLAFVQGADGGEPAVVRLGSAAHVEQLVQKWRAEIDRERGAFGRAEQSNEAAYRAAAAALRRAVWDPLASRIGAAKRVFIVPDGALQLVNFASLPAAGGKYLAEAGPLLHTLSTERDLAAASSTPSGTELFAVANPSFQARADKPELPAARNRGINSSCADFATMQFGALPGSLEEVHEILSIWKGRGWHGTELSGRDATETAVKQNAAGKRVVHLATHGFFLDSNCPAGSVARDNSLLRAGLAFAGANHRQTAAKDQDDGILTAQEAAGLDLEDTEWVVLSGCDTGVGDIKAGEGLLGLRRAFQEAGARTLIASLWPVDDSEARLWMAALYRARFVEQKSTAESERAADINRLRARRAAGKSTHPFYWAGFVATGDWR
jgi:CHAT domain-containing protein